MSKKGFAFLDILGFSDSILSKNYEHTYNMLNQVYVVLDMKDMNGKMRINRKSLQNNIIEKLNSRIEITSFSYIQCISDSILIASDQPDLMVQQIANLVKMCFTLNWGNKRDSLPLVLLRCGISYGEVSITMAKSSLGNKSNETPNIFGEAVVNAVNIEKSFGLKGPRIILDEPIYKELNEETKRNYISLLKIDESITSGRKYYEVLWPAFEFVEDNIKDDIKYNNLNGEINKLGHLLSKAYVFFEEYQNSPAKEHYNSLVSLIFRSTRQIFHNLGGIQIFEEYVKKITDRKSMNYVSKYFDNPFLDLICPNDWNNEFRNYLNEIYNQRIKNAE